MDLVELQTLARKIKDQRHLAVTEEATKTAFVMPLIRLLGYDPNDLTQVRPEQVADVGIKKGEKVDFAILIDDVPILLVEVKKCEDALTHGRHDTQISRYFTNSPAPFAALTNGVVYRFFTDLDAQNKLDTKPFLELDISAPSDETVEGFGRFTPESFDAPDLRSTAERMRDRLRVREFLARQQDTPDDDLVKLLLRHARPHVKRITAPLLEEFRETTREAFRDYVREYAQERIRVGFDSQEVAPAAAAEASSPVSGTGPRLWRYKGASFREKSWASLYVAVLSHLYEHHGKASFYKNLRPLIEGRTLGHIGTTAEDAGGRPKPLLGGWWINVNHPAAQIRRHIRLACDAAAIEFGRDLRIE